MTGKIGGTMSFFCGNPRVVSGKMLIHVGITGGWERRTTQGENYKYNFPSIFSNKCGVIEGGMTRRIFGDHCIPVFHKKSLNESIEKFLKVCPWGIWESIHEKPVK